MLEGQHTVHRWGRQGDGNAGNRQEQSKHDRYDNDKDAIVGGTKLFPCSTSRVVEALAAFAESLDAFVERRHLF